MHGLDVLGDLAVIFFIAVFVVALLRRVGIPTIAGFIVSGAVVGPRALGLVHDTHTVELLAEVGVALLLFSIGLELDISKLKRLWRHVAVSGTLQVTLTAAAVAWIAKSANFRTEQAIFIGFVVAVSSTAIVLRGLEARGEVEAPHGQLTLGVLVFQDLAVVPMMLAIPLLSGSGAGTDEEGRILTIVLAFGKTVAILAGIVLAARIAVPRLLEWVANTRQRDLFILTVFLVSMGTAWVVTKAGISLGLGAFLAGLVVAGSEYRHQALADLMPFREVMTSLFFVSIGMLFDVRLVLSDYQAVLALFGAILVGKFTVVFLAGAFSKLPASVNAMAGAALCQMGEFAFVLHHAAEGTDLMPESVWARLLPASILSMIVTPLAIAAGPKLAAGAAKLRVLDRILDVRGADEAPEKHAALSSHVILAGYGIAGQELAMCLRESGIPYLIVDLNPENVRRAVAEGEPAYFGDITSPEVLEHVGGPRAREIVLAINDPSAAERSLAAIRSVAPQAHIIVRARFVADVEPLLRAGARKVIPAELEAAVYLTAHVLARRSVAKDWIERFVARIRTRQKENATREERLSAVPSINP